MSDEERLARQFHEVYERLAPSFGYATREETREFDPLSPNGLLMVAVCKELRDAEIERLNNEISFYESLANDDDDADWEHGDGRYREWLQRKLRELRTKDAEIERLRAENTIKDVALRWAVSGEKTPPPYMLVSDRVQALLAMAAQKMKEE